MQNSSLSIDSITERKTTVGIIGLGYVGLPLAVLAARKGYKTVGFGRDRKKMNQLQKGDSYITDDFVAAYLKKVISSKKLTICHIDDEEIRSCDILIICVPTPVTHAKIPDLTALKSVAKRLRTIDCTGKLIINESTVAPGTTREVLANLKGHYFLVCSPERVDPGNTTKTSATIPKVVGGINKESTEFAKTFYEQILDATIVTVSSPEAAEMTKMLENTYRAVNIALINEFALLCDKTGVDITEVIAAAKTKWSFHAHYPGIGVGGHCIPVDPYYLLEYAHKHGVSMPVVKTGLAQNESMPGYVADLFFKEYKKGMKVLIYGITYKRNVVDLRESPVFMLISLIQKKKIPFVIYDPLVSKQEIDKLAIPSTTSLTPVDIAIIGTDHSTLQKDAAKFITKKTIVIDGRNYFPTNLGKKTLGIGRRLL